MTLWILKLWKEKEKKRQHIEYLKNEKSFLEEVKIILHNSWNAIFW